MPARTGRISGSRRQHIQRSQEVTSLSSALSSHRKRLGKPMDRTGETLPTATAPAPPLSKHTRRRFLSLLFRCPMRCSTRLARQRDCGSPTKQVTGIFGPYLSAQRVLATPMGRYSSVSHQSLATRILGTRLKATTTARQNLLDLTSLLKPSKPAHFRLGHSWRSIFG